jgi:hypothetical protein
MNFYILFIAIICANDFIKANIVIDDNILKLSFCQRKCKLHDMKTSIDYIDIDNGILCKCIHEDNNCCENIDDCIKNYCNEEWSSSLMDAKKDCVFIESANRCYSIQYLLIDNITKADGMIKELETTPILVFRNSRSSSGFFINDYNTDYISSSIQKHFSNKIESLCKIICLSDNNCKCAELFFEELFTDNKYQIPKPLIELKFICEIICDKDLHCKCKTELPIESNTQLINIDHKIIQICKLICGPNGGVMSKNGNMCKCPEIDKNCCRSKNDCEQIYCSVGERAEDPDKDKCIFVKHINLCYNYKFKKIEWK